MSLQMTQTRTATCKDIYLPEKDPRLSKEDYERSYEQNEMLGLNDMKTENYT